MKELHIGKIRTPEYYQQKATKELFKSGGIASKMAKEKSGCSKPYCALCGLKGALGSKPKPAIRRRRAPKKVSIPPQDYAGMKAALPPPIANPMASNLPAPLNKKIVEFTKRDGTVIKFMSSGARKNTFKKFAPGTPARRVLTIAEKKALAAQRRTQAQPQYPKG